MSKKNKDGNKPLVAVIMGSQSDWDTMRHADETLDKFGGADADRSGWLTAAEYASTAPPPPKPKRCAC